MCYLAALAGIVRHEGAAYRSELARRRSAAAKVGPEQSVAVEKPPPRPPEPPEIIVPKRPEKPSPPPKSELPAVAKADAHREPHPPAKPAVVLPPPDLRRLSLDRSRALGAELYHLITADHPLREDGEKIRRLEDALKTLSASRKHPGEPIQFHLLNSDQVNAFSHIGGHVYVSKAVFWLVQDQEELEFVVAHELAHEELGHAAARLESLAKEAGMSGGLAPTLGHLIALGYTPDQEFQADRWAYKALRAADHTHRESAKFLRRYAGFAAMHNLPGRHPPRTHAGDPHPDVENHYPAHPPASERLKRVEALRVD